MTKDFSTEHAVTSYGRAYIPLQCCVQVEIAELGPPQKMKTRFYTASADCSRFAGHSKADLGRQEGIERGQSAS